VVSSAATPGASWFEAEPAILARKGEIEPKAYFRRTGEYYMLVLVRPSSHVLKAWNGFERWLEVNTHRSLPRAPSYSARVTVDTSGTVTQLLMYL
jgi:hypothetical protein